MMIQIKIIINKRSKHIMSNIIIKTIYKPDGIYLRTTAYGGKN